MLITTTPQIILECARLYPPLDEVLSDVFDACHLASLAIPDGSIRRPYLDEIAKGRSGYHGQDDLDGFGHRCIDVPTPTWDDAQRIADKVNPLWVYDSSRPSKLVVYAAIHGTAPHCHVQVHVRTTRRFDDGANTV